MAVSPRPPSHQTHETSPLLQQKKDAASAEASKIEVIETEPRLEPKKSSLKKKTTDSSNHSEKQVLKLTVSFDCRKVVK